MTEENPIDREIAEFLNDYENNNAAKLAIAICDEFRQRLTSEAGPVASRFALRIMLEADNFQARLDGVSKDMLQRLDAEAIAYTRKVTGQ